MRLSRRRSVRGYLRGSDDLDLTERKPTELSSVALGGTVTSVSDEFFAEAFHLLLVEVRSYISHDAGYP